MDFISEYFYVIIEGRPYKDSSDLEKVDGIGTKTAERFKEYLKFDKTQ